MNILTDLHHRDLYYSLHCLFEKRLGFNLFRPEGDAWHDRGYWTMGDCAVGEHLKNQYLRNGVGENCAMPQNYQQDGVSYVWNPTHQYHAKCLEWELFNSMQFDVIIPSHPAHYESWKKLRNECQPKAAFVPHVGNVSTMLETDHIIRSVPFPGKCLNQVLVHQELNQNIYKHTPPPTDAKKIHSVTNGYHFANLYQTYKEALPECEFRYFGGAGCPDGVLDLHGVAGKMQEARLGWSTKAMGGLGHSNMGWMLSGRPIITNMTEHRAYGECALKLFEPGVTCIDLDSGSVASNTDLIRKWLEPEMIAKHGEMCVKRFHEVINYEEEANNVKQFLAKIL